LEDYSAEYDWKGPKREKRFKKNKAKTKRGKSSQKKDQLKRASRGGARKGVTGGRAGEKLRRKPDFVHQKGVAQGRVLSKS